MIYKSCSHSNLNWLKLGRGQLKNVIIISLIFYFWYFMGFFFGGIDFLRSYKKKETTKNAR